MQAPVADATSEKVPLFDGHVQQGAEEMPVSRLWDRLFALAVAAMVVLVLLRPFYLPVVNGDHYVYLAEHFVRGELSVNDMEGYADVVTFQGNKYLPFGPVPALVLIPFLPLMYLFGTREEVWAGIVLTLFNYYLLARILKQIGVIGERRKWALLLFFGGTVYYSMAVVAAAWHFAHIVGTTCILLAISEALGKKRMLVVGLLVGLAEATRFDLLFALPFFVWVIWHESNQAQNNNGIRRYLSVAAFGRYAALVAGLAIPMILLAAYNYARFGSPIETGYSMAAVASPLLVTAHEYGFYSLVHIPKNLFTLLLQGPMPFPAEDAAVLQPPYIQPSPWGMSIFLTSPAIVYAFRAKWKEPFVRACWLTILTISATLITYYWTGFVQFGYRYALDFMPFLIMIVALGLPKPMTNLSRALILASVLVNIWGAIWLAKWI
ncbi:MAG: hypothetical protein ABI670_02680 [Chloroflexota bacterium]